MLTKRIVPCLDVRNGRVVKGVNFENIQELEDPVALAAYYNETGADELVFYDITASQEGRSAFGQVLREVAAVTAVPLMVGGGISTIADVEQALSWGAEKVSINSGAIKDPKLIWEAAQRFGSPCVVLSMDVKQVDGQYRLFSQGGQKDTGIDALEWARQGAANGAGEIVLNSIDTDGVRQGFDLPMLASVQEVVSVPIVASGGAGKQEDFLALFQELPGVGAGLAASIFHTKQLPIASLKAYLHEQGIPVRL